MATLEEIRTRALELMANRLSADVPEAEWASTDWHHWAVTQAQFQLEQEEENKKRDLDVIEQEIQAAMARQGSIPSTLVDRLLEAARYYRDKHEKPLKTKPKAKV